MDSRAASVRSIGPELPYGEGCVTASTWSDSLIGTANGSNAATKSILRRQDKFVFGQRRHSQRALHVDQRAVGECRRADCSGNAGLTGLGGNGFTLQ